MAFPEHVRLLLGQAIRENMYYVAAPHMKHMVPLNAHVGERGPGTHVAKAGEVRMISEPAILLQRLYAGADPTDRQSFAPMLLALLDLRTARVIARTLAATGNLSALQELSRVDSAAEDLWRGLIHVLRFESPLFSEVDLQVVEKAATLASAMAGREAAVEMEELNTTPPVPGVPRPFVGRRVVHRLPTPLSQAVDELHAVVSRIRYLRLAKTLRENQNPAIDADRQELLSRLQSLGFSAKLSHASNEIERRAATATTDIDVKAVMDLLRTFYEEFTEEACRRVESKVDTAAPSGPKVNHYAPYRQYLENANLIGPEESEFLQKFYNFLSNQGSHKLGSAPEQLRVAHATVVEWCMLIAGRIANFLR